MRGVWICLSVVCAGCQCGPPIPTVDAGTDAGLPSKDAGVDAGRDAGVDAGPVCTAEVCNGVDDDCDGTIDLLPDGGPLIGLCPLQQGTCAGAKIACVGGAFPPCTGAQYGAKYEEFESLCDGVDNDCSGAVDVSQWKPIAMLGTQPRATSVPGAWYVTQHINSQMFDETLTPLTDPYLVGQPVHWAAGAVWFGDYLYSLYGTYPGISYLRKLNLDGTFLGGPDILVVHDGGVITTDLHVANDKDTLVVEFVDKDYAGVVSIFRDGGFRGGPTYLADAGSTRPPHATPLGRGGFLASIAYDDRLVLVPLTAELQAGPPVNVAVPSVPAECSLAADNHGLDSGTFVVACPGPGGLLYATDNPATGLSAIWSGDGGPVRSVIALPSYAKATIFWLHGTSLWMGQNNGLPAVELGKLDVPPARIEVAESVRGGYLIQAVFDGGMGLRPYAAYACPP